MPETKDKIRVGILRGGVGEHYNSSLKNGGDIILHLYENLDHKYKPVDILIDKEGVWHISGVPVLPSQLLYKVDVVWNGAHQALSNILESFSIPTVGTPPFSSAFGTSKEMLREHLRKQGVMMPRSIILPLYQSDFDGPREKYAIKKAKEVFEKFSSPWIVKSLTPDLNMAIHLAKTFPELVGAIEDGVAHGNSVLVEEFIMGKIASVHSVNGFRGEDVYTFPLGNSFGNFSFAERERLANIAKSLHDYLDVRHYLKSDFVMNGRGKIYLLELESMPDLKPGSHFSEVCESVGTKMHYVIEHILDHALS